MIVKRLGPRRLGPDASRRCAPSPPRATPRRPTSSGCASTRRCSPRASPAGPSTCSMPGAIPVVADRSRRPGHVPRAGTGGRLSAGRPAPARHLRQGVRLPPRAGAAEDARGLRRHRPPGARASRASTSGWTIRSATRARRARRRPETRFDGLGKIAAIGVKVSRHCSLPRRRAQRRHGPAALRADRPVRSCRAAHVTDLSTIGVARLVGRGGRDPRRQARRLPGPPMTPTPILRPDASSRRPKPRPRGSRSRSWPRRR